MILKKGSGQNLRKSHKFYFVHQQIVEKTNENIYISNSNTKSHQILDLGCITTTEVLEKTT
jgi:hypothetical protein